MKTIITSLAIVATTAAVLIATEAAAGAQYGNPRDPYLDYQRTQREQASLDLQRRQVEAIERIEIWNRFEPSALPVYGLPVDPIWIGQ